MLKNKYVKLALYTVGIVAFWNLVDYIWSLIDSNNPFQFKVLGSLVIPALMGLVAGYIDFVRKKD